MRHLFLLNWQELRGSALRLLATGLAPSPRTAGARSKHWPSIRVALEGLGLSGNAVAGCKQFLLQVCSPLLTMRTSYDQCTVCLGIAAWLSESL